MKVPRVSKVPRVPIVLVLGAMLVCATGASAQTTAPADQSPAGPLLVEKIENGWLFVPDVRVTDLDNRTGTLAGGYIGKITDRTLVFGGGGYWLTNREHDFELAYGGAVVQWLARGNRTIGFGVRTLVGGGSATLPRELGDLVNVSAFNGGPGGAVNNRNDGRLRFGGRPLDPSTRVAVHDDFFVVEPQADVVWNMTRRYRVTFGVGYRAVAWAPLLGSQLNGVSGSIAFHIAGGS